MDEAVVLKIEMQLKLIFTSGKKNIHKQQFQCTKQDVPGYLKAVSNPSAKRTVEAIAPME